MTLRTADGGRQPSGGAATKSSLCRSIASRKSSVPLRWTHLAPMYKVTFYVTAAELEVFLRSANGCEVLLSHVFFFSWYLYYRRLRCYSALQIRNSEKMQDCGFGAFVTLLMLERADKMLMKCRTSLAKIRSTHSLNFSQIHLDESIIYIHLRPRLVKWLFQLRVFYDITCTFSSLPLTPGVPLSPPVFCDLITVLQWNLP